MKCKYRRSYCKNANIISYSRGNYGDYKIVFSVILERNIIFYLKSLIKPMVFDLNFVEKKPILGLRGVLIFQPRREYDVIFGKNRNHVLFLLLRVNTVLTYKF